jgi:hypothetical protein
MEKWEYFIETIYRPDPRQQFRIPDINIMLNNNGCEGWELVNILQSQSGEWLGVFKRKLVI